MRITSIALCGLLVAIMLFFGCEVKKDETAGNNGRKENAKNPNAQVSKEFGLQGLMLVTLSDIDKIALIDLKTFKVGDIIDVGRNPQDVAFSPDGKTYAATMAGDFQPVESNDTPSLAPLLSNSIWIWESTTHKIIGKSNISLNDQNEVPSGIAIDKNSNKIYIANAFSDTLLIKKLHGEQDEISRVNVGSGPRRILITPDNDYVVTINTDQMNKTETDTVSIIYALSNEETSRVEVGSMPWDGCISATSDKLYVSVSGSNCIKVIDIKSGKILNTFPIENTPKGIDISNDSTTLYVASYDNNTLLSVNAETGEPIDSIEVGNGPEEILFAANSSILLVGNSESNSITVVNVPIWKVADTLNLPGRPSAIAVWDAPQPDIMQSEARTRADLKEMITPQSVQKQEAQTTDK
jgi:YVTN family beta-propeller protein